MTIIDAREGGMSERVWLTAEHGLSESNIIRIGVNAKMRKGRHDVLLATEGLR